MFDLFIFTSYLNLANGDGPMKNKTFVRYHTQGRIGSESRIDMQGFPSLHFSSELQVVHQSLCFHYNIQSEGEITHHAAVHD